MLNIPICKYTQFLLNDQIRFYFLECFGIYKVGFQQVVYGAELAVFLAVVHYGFGLIVVEVGVAFQLVYGGGVEVYFAQLVAVDGDIRRHFFVQLRRKAVHFEQLFGLAETAEPLAVFHYAFGVAAAYAAQLLQVAGVGGVKLYLFCFGRATGIGSAVFVGAFPFGDFLDNDVWLKYLEIVFIDEEKLFQVVFFTENAASLPVFFRGLCLFWL